MSEVISRDLLGKIVDEVFGGAIEDASVIAEIYSVIKREESAPPAADPVCCGRPVHVGSPEAYTLECCEKFIDPTPALAAKALADEIKKLEVSYHVVECIGLADWAAFEAGIAKGLEAAAEKVSARSAQVQDVAMVTRESAINALKHLYAHNGSGRYTDAIAMLVAARAKQGGGG